MPTPLLRPWVEEHLPPLVAADVALHPLQDPRGVRERVRERLLEEQVDNVGEVGDDQPREIKHDVRKLYFYRMFRKVIHRCRCRVI